MRKLILAATGLAAALVSMCGLGCGGSQKTTVSVIGSTSIQPFAEMLAEDFNKKNPDVYVEVQGGGSTAGIQAVTSGIADIGTCSRDLKPEETGFSTLTIARDGVAVVVHLTNPVANLTREQVKDLFSGRASNWKDVGGQDQPVRLITREEGSGTREAFTHLVMGKTRIASSAMTQPSNGAVKELVRHDPNAIGFMSLGLVGKELKAVSVDGVAPSTETVLSGKYPLVRPFLFVMKGEPSTSLGPGPGEAAKRFIDFVLSPTGQEIVETEGLVRAK